MTTVEEKALYDSKSVCKFAILNPICSNINLC
jgi:hypothetical protein